MTDLEEYAKQLGPDWAQALVQFIPEHMHGGILRYVLYGIPAGDFLHAVVGNDLFAALGKADDLNRARIYDYCLFFHNYAPSSCFGSHVKRDAWIAAGGVMGKQAANAKAEQEAEANP